MNLCNYLSKIGAKVCYIEANNQGHLKKLPSAYSHMVVKYDCIIGNGIKYLELNSQCDDEFDFIIYDMGVIESKIVNAIRNKCDVAILCATGKPYELINYENAIALCNDSPIHKVFSFVDSIDQEKIKNKYGNVTFSEYMPSLFDVRKNVKIWEQILDRYIKKYTI